MKVRKLAVALALVGGLGSSVANALGLGEVELQSYLNEPLDADIALRNTGGVSPNEVYVNLAPPAVFERVGISRDFFLTNLQFEVTTAPNGQLVINVTTRQPVREPYLNFLLEVTWPSGKLLREYSMLLDPPVYAAERDDAAPVQAPSTSRSQTAAPATQRTQSAEGGTSSRSTAQAGASQVGGTFGPTGPSDTLWGIALQVRPDESYTPQQVMLALQDLNPNAFMDNNINRLKRGQVLRVPTEEQIASRTPNQASQEVTVQNRALQTPTPAVDATGQQPTVVQQGEQAPQDELRLVAGNDSTSPEDGASSGGADGVEGGAEGSTAVVMEQLDKTRRENEELNSRVEDLQAQLATMQRLVELKNSQLAELQAEAGQAAEQGEGADQPLPGNESDPSAVGGAATGNDAAADEAATDGSAGMEGAAAPEAGQGEQSDTGEVAPAEEFGVDAVEDGSETGSNAVTGLEESGQTPVDGESTPETAGQAAPNEQEQNEPAMAQQAPAQQSVEAEPAQQTEPVQPTVDRGFFGNLLEELKNNRLYQLVAGGIGILVLLLLGLLARRNANREKEFYDQLNAESDYGDDTIDLGGEGDEHGDEDKDALAEADAYIAYGRHDQAAETLESAISREPSRTDLRLKLLAVYADSQDRGAFEKQYDELEALDDEAAMVEAQVLRERLEEAESMPSIDDLESQLRSTSSAETGSFDQTFANLDAESADKEDEDFFGQSSESAKTEEAADDFGLDDLELDEEPLEQEDLGGTKEKDADAPIEYDISDLNLDEESIESRDSADQPETQIEDLESATESEELDISFDYEEKPEADAEPSELSEDDFGSLELDDAFLEDETGRSESAPAEDRATSDDELPPLEEDPELATDDAGVLDESFLDDLDAELEKVASETEDENEPSESETDTLDELELDVSDEDLALMEEVSDTSSKKADSDDEIPELDEELGLEDPLQSADDEDIPTAEESVEAQEASEVEKPKEKRPSVAEFDETALDDEDDFDFLSGTDEAATKLDLARAYIEMGDADGARDILEEVAIEGSDDQKSEAQGLLKNLA
ncbi:motility hub landmark protein FimV [Marinobacter nanhaiticus D15-8W]|uniref:FimV N-terminal domain-containing protein n=1 Tax=Marinobacter nanhaiticus D15-8W TaxID=626887 RepID=N6WT95_9GAMM|nr:FimV/HubP family polar landmark protein [Marinobacter nanhaiticus]ENO14222.1 hypothetical protein J057_22550 [Marinobacter nanhaiticus D15-8W]BES71609.1 motility hub landmark protein FimV [Marinobacter nanhaiticus D15-8W]